MVRAGAGRSHLGSVSWMRGTPVWSPYTTAKAAIQGLTRTLARERAAQHPGEFAGAWSDRHPRQRELWIRPGGREFLDQQMPQV